MNFGSFVGELEFEAHEVVDSLMMLSAVEDFAIDGQVCGPVKADGSAVAVVVAAAVAVAVAVAAGKYSVQGWKSTVEVVDG